MSFNYSVAIRLSVNNLASQGVRMLAADLIKAHGAAVNLQGKLSALKMAAAGLAISKAGDGILGFLGKSIEASKEYTHQIALMKAAGFTQKEVAESVASAWRTTGQVVTSTASDNLVAIRELRSAFGKGEGMQHAYAVLPQVQRVAGILESLTGKHQERVGFDLVKSIEIGTKGALTVESLMRQSEMMTKALVQMQGTLNVADFHQTLKYSRAIAPYMTDQFKYLYLPTLMQEMKAGPSGGASSAGNVIASLGQVVVGQQIPKALIANWISAGLIKPGMVVADKHNRTTSKILPGGVAGSTEFGQNPYFWAQKYALPAVEKLMREKHLDQYGAVLSLTHNRVGAFGLQTLINKSAQFERDAKLIREGPTTYSSYQKLLQLDPNLAQKALQGQWQNMQALIGYQILPQLIPAITRFAQSMADLNQWMSKNPDKLRNIVVGLAGLGLTLSVLGKVLMGLALFKFIGALPLLGKSIGLFVDGLKLLLFPFRFLASLMPLLARGVVTALTAMGPLGWTLLAIGATAILVWNNWKEIWANLKIMFGDMVAGFQKLFNGDIMGALGSFGSVFLRAFQLILNTLLAGLNAVLPKAWQLSKFNFADPSAPAPPPKPMTTWNPVVPPAMRQPVQVQTTLNMDGRKVAEVVSTHQARAAGRPAATSGRFDLTHTPPALAFGGNK